MKPFAQLTLIVFGCVLMLAGSAKRHWTETATETIWRGRYKNCDKGYLIILPSGVVGHGSLLPAPNHGILISASEPGTIKQVTFDDARVISVYDQFDVLEYGGARGALDYQLDSDKSKIKLIETKDLKFRGLPAAYAYYRTKGEPIAEFEELVVYRTPKNLGPIVNHFLLKTTPQHYAQDRTVYVQVRSGFRTISVPSGECSND